MLARSVSHRHGSLLQMRSERGVLPEDHPERVTTRLGLAISAVERGDSSAATSILEAYMDEEEDRITKVCSMPLSAQAYLIACFLNGTQAFRVQCFGHRGALVRICSTACTLLLRHL